MEASVSAHPDAVRERLVLRRFGAVVIDWFVGLLLVSLVTWLGGTVGVWSDAVDGSRATVIDQTLLLACTVGAALAFSLRRDRFGQSIGKRVVRIRTVGTDDLGVIAARDLVKYLPISLITLQPALVPLLLVYVATLVMAVRRRGSSVHDALLGTRVEKAG